MKIEKPQSAARGYDDSCLAVVLLVAILGSSLCAYGIHKHYGIKEMILTSGFNCTPKPLKLVPKKRSKYKR